LKKRRRERSEGEGKLAQLAAQLRIEPLAFPDERCLQGVVLWVTQDVEREGLLEERRVGKADPFGLVWRELKTDRYLRRLTNRLLWVLKVGRPMRPARGSGDGGAAGVGPAGAPGVPRPERGAARPGQRGWCKPSPARPAARPFSVCRRAVQHDRKFRTELGFSHVR
jgi:hypothetical protein